jgi:hypothetical protein
MRHIRDTSAGIAYLLNGETAAALGVAGKKLAFAIDTLQRFDRGQRIGTGLRRPQLLQTAADALWAYVVQKEALGLSDHAALADEFGVTAELWNRIGALDRAGLAS